MPLGTTLGLAGVAGEGWRQAENAERVSRANQLRLAELNRAEFARKRALERTIAPAPQAPQFRAELLPSEVPDETLGPATSYAVPGHGLKLPAADTGLSGLPGSEADGQRSAAITTDMGEITLRRAAVQRELRSITGPISRFMKPAWFNRLPAEEQKATVARLTKELKELDTAYTTQVVPWAEGRPPEPPEPTQPERPTNAGIALPETPPTADSLWGNIDRDKFHQAWMFVESRHDQNAVSGKGAIGVSQSMVKSAMDPGYGAMSIFDLAKQRGYRVQSRSAAEAKRLLSKDARLNAAWGAQYMEALATHFDDPTTALIAYNMGPGATTRWLRNGADPAKLPAETRNHVARVEQAYRGDDVALEYPLGVSEDSFETQEPYAGLVLQQSPMAQGETLEQREDARQRQRLVQRAMRARNAGDGQQYQELLDAIEDFDAGAPAREGLRAIEYFNATNDPIPLARVWGQSLGVDLALQQRRDGLLNIFVDGALTKQGVTIGDFVQTARLSFDPQYREAQAAFGATQSSEEMKLARKIREVQAEALAGTLRDQAVESTKGQIEANLEKLKAQLPKNTQVQVGPDGSVYITSPTGRVFEYSVQDIAKDGVPIRVRNTVPIDVPVG
jgi:hypothetical protein